MNGFLILLHSVLIFFFIHSLFFCTLYLAALTWNTMTYIMLITFANGVRKKWIWKREHKHNRTYLVLISTNKNASHWANKSECIRWYRARVQACKHWQTHCTQIETGIGKIPTIKWNCIAHLNANERLYTIEMLSCFPKTHSLFTTSAPLFADTS